MAKYAFTDGILPAVKPPRCTTGSVEPVNGINKDASDARLLPINVPTYLVDCLLLSLTEDTALLFVS